MSGLLLTFFLSLVCIPLQPSFPQEVCIVIIIITIIVVVKTDIKCLNSQLTLVKRPIPSSVTLNPGRQPNRHSSLSLLTIISDFFS